MSLKRYDVEINGYKTTLQLSDEDAKEMGLTKPVAEEKAAKTPPNKARTTAANKRAAAVSKSFGHKGDA